MRAQAFVAAVITGGCVWWWSSDPTSAARRLAALRGVCPHRALSPSTRLPRRGRRSAHPTASELPPVLDLLAACLSAGAMLGPALSAVALAFDGPAGALLADIARLSSLGAPPEDAWSAALRDPSWAPIARAVIRAHHSGAALTEVLNRVASELRRDLRTKVQAAAARASVKAVLPLGLCFLPAFLLVGVVPVVAGFTTSLW